MFAFYSFTIVNMEKVFIDPETADRIVICSLRETIKNMKIDIAAFKKKKRLEEYEKEDLDNLLQNIKHLEATYIYYGGNLN